MSAVQDDATEVDSASPLEDEFCLQMRGVCKSYPGVRALHQVSIDVRPGEIHGLVGENGAGKSTLMKIASGTLRSDEGTVEVVGHELQAHGDLGRDYGLSMVHQRPALLPDLTVAENFLLAVPEGRHDQRGVHGWVRSWLEPWGALAQFDTNAVVEDLTPAEHFVIEIARALAANPRVLILDEPTEHLDRGGVEVLFDAVGRLRDRNCGVVYISHRVREVRRLANRITVLRDGQSNGTFAAADVTEPQLVELIAGRPLESLHAQRSLHNVVEDDDAGGVALSLHDFCGPGFEPLNLTVLKGEIVGLAGIEDNGQRDVLRALAGLTPTVGGVRVGDSDAKVSTTRSAIRAGLAYLPSDRHREGLLHNLGVRENMSISSLSSRSLMGFVRNRTEAASVRAQMKSLNVKSPSMATSVESLSGGNQQKVMIARTLLSDPVVFLADEPTQGVDVGARAEIYRILRGVAEQRGAVIVVSSDTSELEGICDRVIVFCRGSVVAELAGDDVQESKITSAAVTATTHRERSANDARPGALRRLARSETGPAALLAMVIALLGAYTAVQNDAFLSARNIEGLLGLVAALAFISIGQQVVMFAGGIDLSVGALAGLLVVISSFWIIDGASPARLLIGVVVVVLVALGVGLLNWFLADVSGMQPLVATLVTFMGLQGVSLTLRKTPDGFSNPEVIDVLLTSVGPVPVAFVASLGMCIALEFALRRTQLGISLRAVGSEPDAAERLGVDLRRVRLIAYVSCSGFVIAGAAMLMTQIRIGDPTAGTNYTLSSIGAVVLGGASIYGGRGSFIGAIAGAFLISQIGNVTTFLRLTSSWQLFLVGGLTIASAALYTQINLRGKRRPTGSLQ